MDHLLAGKPMIVDTAEVGMEPLTIIITGGPDKETIAESLRAYGLLTMPDPLAADDSGGRGQPEHD